MKIALTLIATVILTASASAASITVPNYDFSVNPPGVVNAGGTSTAIPDFTVTLPGNYFGAFAQNDPHLPNDPDVAFINGNGGGTGVFTTDSLSTTIAPLTTYTLSLDVGFNSANSPASYQSPSPTVTLGFLANGMSTGVTTVTAAQIEADPTYSNGSNNFTTFTYSFTTGSSGGFVDDDLEVQFTADLSGATQTQFDDVRITADAVPEPSTYVMMMGSLALLGFCLRRKLACLACK
jgi:hypothetical protein